MIFLKFWLIFMQIYRKFFLLTGFGSTFLEVDPDPAK